MEQLFDNLFQIRSALEESPEQIKSDFNTLVRYFSTYGPKRGLTPQDKYYYAVLENNSFPKIIIKIISRPIRHKLGYYEKIKIGSKEYINLTEFPSPSRYHAEQDKKRFIDNLENKIDIGKLFDNQRRVLGYRVSWQEYTPHGGYKDKSNRFKSEEDAKGFIEQLKNGGGAGMQKSGPTPRNIKLLKIEDY